MAVINKIRRYSGVAIFFIAFAILAFILADLIGPSGKFWGSGGIQNVGEINGSSISYEEYNNEVEILRQNYLMSTQQNPDENMMTSLREQAWNTMIFKKSYMKEFENLGIEVSEKELYQMVQGDSVFIHSWVRQQFTNQQTQKFDKALVVNYLQQVGQMPASEQARWANFEDALRKERLRNKYENLIKASTYVTKAEAEREYINQNTKAEVKYLHIPFTSIVDSTLAAKITDKELQAYLDKNKEKYKGNETRSLEYITFDIKPSKLDSAEFLQEIKDIAKGFARATNDSTFAQSNSDNANPNEFLTVDKIPAVLFNNNPTILKGGLYGPYLDGKIYKIFKVSDIKEDSSYFARASHILLGANKTAPAEEKEKARNKANEILQKIKSGESFEDMARQHGTDGTAAQGGDLGWFGKGRMVAPFENAVFDAKDIGLLPNIVETDFGYHIIKVTYPKMNKQYKLAIIDKMLDPSDETRNEVFKKAEQLLSTSETGNQLRENVKKNPALVILKAEKLPTNASNIGNISGAREVVRWAFGDDAKIGDVSPVFDLQDQNKYIIATLIAKTIKDESSIDNFREELKAEVLKEIKKEQILKKLNTNAKTLEEMAKKYGSAALVNTASDLAMANNVFQNVGFNPIAVGTAIGLKKGKRSKAFSDETGIFVLESIKSTPAAKIADYSQYKNQLLQSTEQRSQYQIGEAIKEASKIEDRRYKFY